MPSFFILVWETSTPSKSCSKSNRIIASSWSACAVWRGDLKWYHGPSRAAVIWREKTHFHPFLSLSETQRQAWNSAACFRYQTWLILWLLRQIALSSLFSNSWYVFRITLTDGDSANLSFMPSFPVCLSFWLKSHIFHVNLSGLERIGIVSGERNTWKVTEQNSFRTVFCLACMWHKAELQRLWASD